MERDPATGRFATTATPSQGPDAQDAPVGHDAPPAKFELTEREIAIARGEDPDAPAEIANAVEGEGEYQSEPATEGAGFGGGTEAAAPAGESWIDRDALTLAHAYDLTEDDLKGFSGADEFRRAVTIFERQAAKFRGAEGQAGQQPPAQNAKQPESAAAEGELPSLNLDDYKPEDGWDDKSRKIVEVAKALQDQVTLQQQWIEHQQQQAVMLYQQQQAVQFHSALDQNQDRYGRLFGDDGALGKLDTAKDAARRKVYDAYVTIHQGLVQRGQNPPPMHVLLKQAEYMAFGPELATQAREKVSRAVAAQSARRRPAAGRPMRTEAGATGRASGEASDPAKDLANHPEIVKLWGQLTEASGAAA